MEITKDELDALGHVIFRVLDNLQENYLEGTLDIEQINIQLERYESTMLCRLFDKLQKYYEDQSCKN